MSGQPQASPSLGGLSAEIWLIIFRAISDIPSLRALALTNSVLHEIFTSNASSISFAVLSNEIPATILPEAIAAWSASHITPWSRLRVQGFLQQYHSNREAQCSQSWTLSKALGVSKLHHRCRFFASEFCASVLSTKPTSGSPTSSFPPSLPEVTRIERTFHRFELYCNLFRKQSRSQKGEQRFSETEQQDIYFKHYAAWENEQLACVHDYLFRRLSVPFNDLALHDVEWGENMISIISDQGAPENFWKESVLSLGLAFLQDLVAAQTYEQRRQLLGPNLTSDDQFLHEGLMAQGEYDERLLDELSAANQSEVVNKPFFQDEDVGPEEAWKWAYRNRELSMLYYDLELYDLRAWGFCLWDHARLTSWGVFNMACDDREYKTYHDYLSEDHIISYEELSKSWDKRSKIWNQGGRGWWKEGDESRIVWDRFK